MKKVAFALSSIILTTAGCVSSDSEYDYIPTPKPIQIADLLDDDSDGVINARDLCELTPQGAEINNEGCGRLVETSDSLGLHILFENDSSEILPIFKQQIAQMADFLKQYPETSIEIQGFASKVGDEDYNLALSKRRAKNVELELESYGISPQRVSIIGYGENKLENDGDDELSHARNRKVVANVVGHKGEVVKEWTIFTRLDK